MLEVYNYRKNLQVILRKNHKVIETLTGLQFQNVERSKFSRMKKKKSEFCKWKIYNILISEDKKR